MKYDHVIAGGGSAGAVLASRLSENPKVTVCLLEAGIDTPPGNEPADVRDTYYSTLYQPAYFWQKLVVRFNASRRESAGLRPYEQARLLGGGSAVNAMIGLRGLPSDYDDWGIAGWRWNDVLPYFRRLESDHDFGGPLHGTKGPIPIRRHTREQWPGFCKAVAASLEKQGWKHVADMNGEPEDGMFRVPMTSMPGHRVSSAMGYLGSDVRARPNLTIICNAYVEKLRLVERRIVGLQASINGKVVEFDAKEVIVSAGAIHSPAILQRSGIGPAAVLRAAGVEPLIESDGVGANLHDHPMVSVACHLRPQGRAAGEPRAAANLGLRYTSGVQGCIESDMYVSVANKGSWHAVGRQIGALVMCLYKPYSRGTVRISSSDTRAEPDVDFNLLDDVRDEDRLAEAVHLAGGIYASAELKDVINDAFPAGLSNRVRALNVVKTSNRIVSALGARLLDGPKFVRRFLMRRFVNPGVTLATLLSDETQLRGWIRERVVAFYHPVGTCRMGAADDPMAVTDERGAVYGVQGLRVIDASMIPSIPRANTNLPVIMIAEKIAAELGLAPTLAAMSACTPASTPASTPATALARNHDEAQHVRTTPVSPQ